MPYLWFKTFHIVGIVVWFSGLFYLVRLFVYHAEAAQKSEAIQKILKPQYALMEKRLYNMITTPGMVLAVTMSIAMLIVSPSLLQETWLQVKLVLVGFLIAYHFYCGWVLRQLAEETSLISSQQFRALNEVPTVFLFAVVLLAVFKNSLPMSELILAVTLLIISMVVMFKLYALKRRQQPVDFLALGRVFKDY